MNLNILRRVKLVGEEPKKPSPPMMIERNSIFVYTKGSDVMKTFKRHGFIPPTEYRTDYLFKKNREMSNE